MKTLELFDWEKMYDIKTLLAKKPFRLTDIDLLGRKKTVELALLYYRKNGFPYYKIEKEKAEKIFKKLQDYDSNLVCENDIFSQDMKGLSLAWQYFPHAFDVLTGKSTKTPLKQFNNDDSFRVCLNKVFDWCVKHEDAKMSENRIRQGLKFFGGINGVSNFRPTVAKYIYDNYSGHGVVWDMCAGWGGRLLGALVSSKVKKYIGTEPSTKTFQGLNKLAKDFLPHCKNKKIEIHNRTCEDFIQKPHSLDLCFTSPPYFDTEKYSTETTQSCLRYPTRQKWKEGFLFKTLKLCHVYLKINGYLVINIANVKTYPDLEDVMEVYCRKLGFFFIKKYKMILSSNSGRGVKYEPVFVFKKK